MLNNLPRWEKLSPCCRRGPAKYLYRLLSSLLSPQRARGPLRPVESLYTGSTPMSLAAVEAARQPVLSFPESLRRFLLATWAGGALGAGHSARACSGRVGGFS